MMGMMKLWFRPQNHQLREIQHPDGWSSILNIVWEHLAKTKRAQICTWKEDQKREGFVFKSSNVEQQHNYQQKDPIRHHTKKISKGLYHSTKLKKNTPCVWDPKKNGAKDVHVTQKQKKKNEPITLQYLIFSLPFQLFLQLLIYNLRSQTVELLMITVQLGILNL